MEWRQPGAALNLDNPKPVSLASKGLVTEVQASTLPNPLFLCQCTGRVKAGDSVTVEG